MSRREPKDQVESALGSAAQVTTVATEQDAPGAPAVGQVHVLPDGPAGGDGLTDRQRLVLETIQDAVDRRGYPPSMREIGEAVGLTSPSSVAHQLSTLERKGYLRRDPNRPRAIEVTIPSEGRHPAAGADLDLSLIHISEPTRPY